MLNNESQFVASMPSSSRYSTEKVATSTAVPNAMVLSTGRACSHQTAHKSLAASSQFNLMQAVK